MSDTNRDDLLAKIQALLNKTADNGATEHEADTALTFARKLMDKHGLSTVDVDAFNTNSTKAADATFRKDRKSGYKEKVIPPFKWTIALAVEELTDTFVTMRSVFVTRPNGGGYWAQQLQYIGEELDVAVAVAMYDMLLRSGIKRAKTEWGGGEWTTSSKSYIVGYSNGLWERASQIRRAAERDMGTHDANTTALVRESKKAWLQRVLIEEGLIPDPAKTPTYSPVAVETSSTDTVTEPLKARKARKRPEPKMDWNAFNTGREDGLTADTNVRNKVGA